MKKEFKSAYLPVWKEFLEFQSQCTVWAETVMAGEWSEEVRAQFWQIENRKQDLDRRILSLRKYEQVIPLPCGQEKTLQNPWNDWVHFLAQTLVIRVQAVYGDFLKRHQDQAYPIIRPKRAGL